MIGYNIGKVLSLTRNGVRKDAIKEMSEGFFFFFKQKTAYEIYQCDWSSDVCSSDLNLH